jgi:hypothetical protein
LTVYNVDTFKRFICINIIYSQTFK